MMQLVDPEEGWYVPAEHNVQLVALFAEPAEYDPAGQGTQANPLT